MIILTIYAFLMIFQTYKNVILKNVHSLCASFDGVFNPK
jgi:hypothetical protein